MDKLNELAQEAMYEFNRARSAYLELMRDIESLKAVVHEKEGKFSVAQDEMFKAHERLIMAKLRAKGVLNG